MTMHFLASKIAQMTPCPSQPSPPFLSWRCVLPTYLSKSRLTGRALPFFSTLNWRLYRPAPCFCGKTKPYLNNKKWKSFPRQTVSSAPWLAEQNVDIKRNCFFFPDAKNVSLDLPRHSDWLTADINPSHPMQSLFDLLSSGEKEGVAFIFLCQHLNPSNFPFIYLCEKQGLEKGRQKGTCLLYFFWNTMPQGFFIFNLFKKEREEENKRYFHRSPSSHLTHSLAESLLHLWLGQGRNALHLGSSCLSAAGINPNAFPPGTFSEQTRDIPGADSRALKTACGLGSMASRN